VELSTPFDDSREARESNEAAHAYVRAAERTPETPEYRAAWLRFRERIKTTADLDRWRAQASVDDDL
jgi:hypothetical protein